MITSMLFCVLFVPVTIMGKTEVLSVKTHSDSKTEYDIASLFMSGFTVQ
jgi:hypothetical protein